MALLDGLSGRWGQTIFIGVAVGLATPVIMPILWSVARPLAKSVIKEGLIISDKVKEITAEAREQLGDLVAEVKAERADTTPAGAQLSSAQEG
ncbi:MAG: DUF5132 domain-containing protein [bacterium]